MSDSTVFAIISDSAKLIPLSNLSLTIVQRLLRAFYTHKVPSSILGSEIEFCFV